jgi:hypothetical protein
MIIGEQRTPAAAARGTGRGVAAMLGAAGSLACGVSMILLAAGIGASATATGMSSMTRHTAAHGLLGTLARIGPGLLAASVLLVTVAFALTHRPLAAAPALLAGAVLYIGMYAQTSQAVMFVSIAAGYLTWLVLFLWVRRDHRATTVNR